MRIPPSQSSTILTWTGAVSPWKRQNAPAHALPLLAGTWVANHHVGSPLPLPPDMAVVEVDMEEDLEVEADMAEVVTAAAVDMVAVEAAMVVVILVFMIQGGVTETLAEGGGKEAEAAALAGVAAAADLVNNPLLIPEYIFFRFC